MPVTCAMREPAETREVAADPYPTPGCSCEGYQRAVEDARRYRDVALGLSCMTLTTRGRCPDGVNWGVRSLCGSRAAGGFCDAVVKEVDGE